MTVPIWNEDITLDSSVSNIVGMLTQEERRYLHTHMKDLYTGQGEAVELGSFTGSSTGATLSGMALNPRALGKSLHVYDLFIWDSVVIDIYKMLVQDSELDMRDGDSFQPLFYENIGQWADRVQVYAGDIRTFQWSGQPIEFLFVDILKSPDITKHVISQFFTSLMADVSFVIHQDFKHWYTSWIHMLMYRLREHFEPVYSVANGGSLVFRCIAPISMQECERACAFDEYTEREISDSFRYSLDLISSEEDNARREIKQAWLMQYLRLIQTMGLGNVAEALAAPSVQQHVVKLFGNEYDQLKEAYHQLKGDNERLKTEWENLKFDPQFMSQQISWRRLLHALVYKLRK